MRSRTSFVRIQAAEEVRTSLATFGGKVATHLDGRRPQTPPAEGEPGFTYQGLFDHLDEELEAVQQGLVDAEDAHLRRKIQVSQLSTESEALTKELYNFQVSARRGIAAAFGTERSFEVAAVSGNTPRELWSLVDQVDQTIKLLEEPVSELPVPIAQGAVDVGVFASELEEGLSRLRKAGAGLERARKAAGESMIVKNLAIAEFNAVFPWVAQTLESLFRLAGESELADRIRTSARRVTRNQAAEGEEPEGGSTSEDGAPEPVGDGEPASSTSVS